MKTYLRLLSFARPFGLGIPAYLFSTILYSIFSVVNLAILIPILQVLFDQVAPSGLDSAPEWNFSTSYFKEYFHYYFNKIIEETGKAEALEFVCLALVISFLLSNVFKYISEIIIVRFKTNLIRNMRKQFFDRLLSMQIGFFTDSKKGDIMSKGMNDIQEVENTITHTLKVYVREPFLLIAYFVALFSISIKLTLISLFLLPISGGFISYVARSLKRKARNSQESLSTLNSILDELLSGIRVIKSFNAKDYVSQKFGREVNNYARFTFSMQVRFALARPISEFFGVIVVVAIILIGGNMILQGDNQLNASQFITFVAIFSQILNPAKALSNAFSFLQRGLAAGERIFGIIDLKPMIKDVENARTFTEFKEEVRFEQVSFAYQNEPVLKGINLNIKKGEKVALVGPSGGGKSTLSDLLPRFYDPTEGQISVDGTNIKSFSIASWRSLFGIVTQESILFNDTVFNNIAFGKPHIQKEKVIEAARIANALEFIEQLDEGFETFIGDRGSKLSGGQKQRLSIARAILHDPAFLILDEATSALDSESEKLVQNAMDSLMQNRTALIIAHRLSTIQNADKIVVLENGKIIEMGKHEELLLKKGMYFKLFTLQSF